MSPEGAPDGKTAATHSPEEAVRLWDLESGRELGKIAVTPPPEWSAMPRFSPDGRSLMVHHKGGQMYLWEVASGQVRYSAPGTHNAHGFSPNGRLFFSLATNLWWIDNKQIFVWDLTGEQTGGVLKPVKHTTQAQADLGTDLQSKVDAGKAYRALWRLAADPEQTVPFLTEKVGAIGPALPKVTKLDAHPSPAEKILACRIVELLEQIGTPEARRLLETLATPAKPQFSDAARQALARLTGN